MIVNVASKTQTKTLEMGLTAFKFPLRSAQDRLPCCVSGYLITPGFRSVIGRDGHQPLYSGEDKVRCDFRPYRHQL